MSCANSQVGALRNFNDAHEEQARSQNIPLWCTGPGANNVRMVTVYNSCLSFSVWETEDPFTVFYSDAVVAELVIQEAVVFFVKGLDQVLKKNICFSLLQHSVNHLF